MFHKRWQCDRGLFWDTFCCGFPKPMEKATPGSPYDMKNSSFLRQFALVQGIQSFRPFSQKAGFLQEPQVLPFKKISGQWDLGSYIFHQGWLMVWISHKLSVCLSQTLAFFWFLFAWNMFFHPFNFSLCVSSWNESLVGSIWMGINFIQPLYIF